MGQQLKAVTSEKWWWVIIVFYLLFQWAGAVKNGSMAYFCRGVLGADWYMSILSILGAVPMAIAAAFVVPLANKFSKQKLTLAGLALGVVGGVIAGLGGNNLVVVGIGIALKCLGSSPACYLILAMLADVIDHVEYKHGIRTDGLTMSIYSSPDGRGDPPSAARLFRRSTACWMQARRRRSTTSGLKRLLTRFARC